jgi:hypothetical protein
MDEECCLFVAVPPPLGMTTDGGNSKPVGIEVYHGSTEHRKDR